MDILISRTYVEHFLLGVDTVGVVDGSVPLGDTDTGGSGSGQVSAGMQTHVSEALDRRIADNPVQQSRQVFK